MACGGCIAAGACPCTYFRECVGADPLRVSPQQRKPGPYTAQLAYCRLGSVCARAHAAPHCLASGRRSSQTVGGQWAT
eukprot:161535-Chlamydomonas_euryale.AAC.1